MCAKETEGERIYDYRVGRYRHYKTLVIVGVVMLSFVL